MTLGKYDCLPILSSVFSTSFQFDNDSLDEFMPDYEKRLRRSDDFVKLGVMASLGAVAALGKSMKTTDYSSWLGNTGIFLGTVNGPLETNFRFLDGLIDHGEGQTSPTLFSHSIYNAAAGYIARFFDIRGPVMTFTGRTWPFLEALRTACLMISSGRIRRGIVVGVEVLSPLLKDVMIDLGDLSETGNENIIFPNGTGGVAWVVESQNFAESPFVRLGEIKMFERMCDASFFLLRSGEMWWAQGKNIVEIPDFSGMGNGYAIDSLFALSFFAEEILKLVGGWEGAITWIASSSFGSASIEFLRE